MAWASGPDHVVGKVSQAMRFSAEGVREFGRVLSGALRIRGVN